MEEISTLSRFKEVIKNCNNLYLYGAGPFTSIFLSNLRECNINLSISKVLVTKLCDNPSVLEGYDVVEYDQCEFDCSDIILLVTNDNVKNEIYETIKNCKAQIYNPSQKIFYNDVYESIAEFVDDYKYVNEDYKVCDNQATYIWTMWWQGEEQMPEIVKCCIESQRKNMPDNVQHIIITKENYSSYVDIPNHILDKYQEGKITIQTLSDYIRMSLLYNRGGLWCDATLWVMHKMPDEVFELPYYTITYKNKQFSVDIPWAGWFLKAYKGNLLTKFVMDAFDYYYTKYDAIKYYWTIDWFIALAMETIPTIQDEFRKIPNNNETSLRLGEHFEDEYAKRKFQDYTEGCFIQKLTWKVPVKEGSIAQFILRGNVYEE